LKLASLTPSPGAPAPFEYRVVRRIGVDPGCYVLTNASGDILYIGQAVCIRSRLLQHLDSGRHRDMTPLGVASFVSILTLDDPIKLDAYERGWINQCDLADGSLPPLNKIPGHL
jgi:excinuclease UvrABC nuclease subunit